MATLAEFRAQLNEAREALLALVRELPHEALVRRPATTPSDDDERWAVRDVLWHVGEQEQRWRRWIAAAQRGEQLAEFARQRRPAHANALPQLLDWLAETRDATLELIGDLATAKLRRPHPSPRRGDELSFEQVLGLLVRHDRMHAEQVQDLLREQGR